MSSDGQLANCSAVRNARTCCCYPQKNDLINGRGNGKKCVWIEGAICKKEWRNDIYGGGGHCIIILTCCYWQTEPPLHRCIT